MNQKNPKPTNEHRKLAILKDDPLFWTSEPFNAQEDAFNHEAYARALFKLLVDNEPPLTIGLFGSWGIGKSTIIGILKGLLSRSEDAKLRFVYFNAWKYSGDSFRRQFLIEAARQILAGSPQLDSTVKRIERLNYTDVLRETPSHSLTALLKDLVSLRIKVKQSFLVRIALAIITLAIGGVVSITTRSLGPLLTSILPAVLLFFLKAKFEDVFVIQENPIFDPKLIFPEQFESTFDELLSGAKALDNHHVVLVIDDIDRCDPSIVKDILISIKTFLGNKRCFFVVPCDEDVVVEAFQAQGPTQRYRDELLRKYFNVGIRIAPLMGSDLIDFANKVARTTDIPETVIQMAVLTNCRDARKMKQFLNTYTVKYEIAKTREQNKYFPLDVDENVGALAKAILLEDVDPRLMEILLQNPDAYSLLERAASDPIADADLAKYGLQGWREKYPHLERVLRRTRDIGFKDVEVFLTLKTANPETRLPRGYELKEVMLAGDLSKLSEMLKSLSNTEDRTNLVSVLTDALQHSRALFLKNIVSAAIQVYSEPDFLAPSDLRRLGAEVGHTLRLNRPLRLLDFDSVKLLVCSKDNNFLEESYGRLLDEATAKDAAPPKVSVVNALYNFSPNRLALAKKLNSVATAWSDTEAGLQLLASIRYPDNTPEAELVPSSDIVLSIIGSLAFGSADEGKLNSSRQSVIVNHWQPQLAVQLINKILMGFQALGGQTSYDANIDLLTSLLLAVPNIVSEQKAVDLWPYTNTWYSKTTQSPGRWRLYQVTLLFVIYSLDNSVRTAALNIVQQAWTGAIKTTIEPTLSFLKLRETERSLEVQKLLIADQAAKTKASLASPNERTKETLDLLHDNRQLLASPSTLTDLFIEGLNIGSGDNLTWWKKAIEEYDSILNDDFRISVLESTMKGLEGGSFDKQKTQLFGDLFTAFYGKSNESTKYSYLTRFWELCKHSNQDVRQTALASMKTLKESSNSHQFKLGLNKLVGDICYSPEAQIMSFRESLEKTFEFNDFFTAYEWREIAHACKRLLQASDVAQREFGLDLLTRFDTLPTELEFDLVQLLINVSGRSEQAQAAKARQLIDRFRLTENLTDESKKILAEYAATASGSGANEQT